VTISLLLVDDHFCNPLNPVGSHVSHLILPSLVIPCDYSDLFRTPTAKYQEEVEKKDPEERKREDSDKSK
jgi:hypothetical protein